MANNEWTRDEYIVVLDLYLNQDIVEDSRDPQVREVAELIDRSPGSVGLRLANYRHVDPESTEGMSHISKAGREIWEEYYDNNDELAEAAEAARKRLSGNVTAGTSETVETGEQEISATQRVGQTDFRLTIRNRFQDTCVLCDISRPGLLQAGHILDWSENETVRGDPSNGLLLCYTHHRAFDIGLFTITEDYRMAVSPHLEDSTGFMKQTIVDMDGEEVLFPGDPPNPDYLREHNQKLEWME